jgi:hypothetical protein
VSHYLVTEIVKSTQPQSLLCRTDNSIKNHFYSTLRKLISRVQKEEIPPEMSRFKCPNELYRI